MQETEEQKVPAAVTARTAASRARREAVVIAAKSVFFEEGFQLASMELIAKRAGTTKRTLYDYFFSKEALFSEVIALASRLFVGSLPKPEELPEDTKEGLRTFANHVRGLVSTSEGIRFQRTVIAEAERHPEFGCVLYETGVLGAEKILARYIDLRIRAGHLRPHDSRISSHVIVDLVTNSALRRLFAAQDAESDQLAAAALDEVIALFINNYGVLNAG
ncbi:MAG: TetR/AcrR family transcriptional regulator [Candidatus Binataceae bacterium]